MTQQEEVAAQQSSGNIYYETGRMIAPSQERDVWPLGTLSQRLFVLFLFEKVLIVFVLLVILSTLKL
jgi:hypothetical protein